MYALWEANRQNGFVAAGNLVVSRLSKVTGRTRQGYKQNVGYFWSLRTPSENSSKPNRLRAQTFGGLDSLTGYEGHAGTRPITSAPQPQIEDTF